MARVQNQPILHQILRPIFRQRSRVDWIERLESADVPYAPIYTLEETLADPQVRHLGVERHLLHPTEGTLRTVQRPIIYDGDRAGIEISPPPTLDEHGVQIRQTYGVREDSPVK
jgi:formyl-CoA transferase